MRRTKTNLYDSLTDNLYSYSRRNLDYHEVLQNLAQKGISIRVASPKLVMEEVCGL